MGAQGPPGGAPRLDVVLVELQGARVLVRGAAGVSAAVEREAQVVVCVPVAGRQGDGRAVLVYGRAHVPKLQERVTPVFVNQLRAGVDGGGPFEELQRLAHLALAA